MKKNSRIAKIGQGHRASPIWLSEEFVESTTYVVLLDKYL